MAVKEWTKPQNVISLILALTGLLAAWTEHRARVKTEGKLDEKRERVEELDRFIGEQRTILFE